MAHLYKFLSIFLMALAPMAWSGLNDAHEPEIFERNNDLVQKFSTEIQAGHQAFVYRTDEPAEKALVGLCIAEKSDVTFELVAPAHEDKLASVLYHLIAQNSDFPGTQLVKLTLKAPGEAGLTINLQKFFGRCLAIKELTIEGFLYDEDVRTLLTAPYDDQLRLADARADKLLTAADAALMAVRSSVQALRTLDMLHGLERPHGQLEERVASVKAHLNEIYEPRVRLPQGISIADLGPTSHQFYNLYRVAALGYANLAWEKLVLDQQIVGVTTLLAAQTASTLVSPGPPSVDTIPELYRKAHPELCKQKAESLAKRMEEVVYPTVQEAYGRLRKEIVAMVYTKEMLDPATGPMAVTLLKHANQVLEQNGVPPLKNLSSYLMARNNAYGIPGNANVLSNPFIRRRLDEKWAQHLGFLKGTAMAILLDDQGIVAPISNPGFDGYEEALTLMQATHAVVYSVFNPFEDPAVDQNDPGLLASFLYDYHLARLELENAQRNYGLVTGHAYRSPQPNGQETV